MAKYFLYIFLFCFGAEFCFGQDFEWAKGMGGSGNQEGHSVITDASGHIYSTGIFESTSDFDPGSGTQMLTSAGGDDVYISKLDPAGNLIWTKQLGTTTDEWALSITLDPDNNVIVTGFFEGTVDFDPGAGVYNLTSGGMEDVFIIKLDLNGNLIWALTFGGIYDARGYSVIADSFGNLYVTGYFTGNVDFDPGLGIFTMATVATSIDIFVSKFDEAGNFIWAKKIGGAGYDQPYSILLDGDENICLTGLYLGTVDFDPGPGNAPLSSSSGSTDIFILKLNSTGSYLWAMSIGGAGVDVGRSLVFDSFDNIYLTGQFSGTSDFDPSPSIYNLTLVGGSEDAFVAKYNSNGAFLWVKQFGGSSWDAGYGVSVDIEDNVYTTGHFSSVIDFDPGTGTYNLSNSGARDVFISKLDPDGQFLWAGKMGGSNSDYGNGIDIDNFGAIVTTGLYRNTVDFDPGPGVFNMSAIGSEIFIQKLGCDTSYSSQNTNACGSYTVPSGDETYLVSGTYNDTVQNVYGCVQVITINVAIMSNTTSNLAITKCTFYEVPSGDEIYTSSGIYNDTIPNSVGCDSVITISLNIIPPTLDTITVIDCTNPYTVPSGDETYNITGIYHDTIPNFSGCDSILTIYYFGGGAINLNVTSCGPYTVPSGDETYSVSGIYMDTLTSVSGCDSILEIDLEIFPTPSANFNADSLQGCTPMTVNFSNLTTPAGTNCTWLFGDGGTSGWDGATIGHTYSVAGSYNVTLISENLNGCIDSFSVLDIIIAHPYPVLVQIPDDEICDGTFYNVPLFDAGIPGCLFQWTIYDSGGTQIANGITNPANFTVNLNNNVDEIIDVHCVVYSPEGCADTMSFEILVHPAPHAIFTSDLLGGCAPLEVNFENLSVLSGGNCTWYFSDGNSTSGCATVSNTFLNPGMYDISLVVETIHGCIDSGAYNDYIAVTSGVATSSTINPVACNSYLSPEGNTYTTSGTYIDYIANTSGCDSVITINLTITTVPIINAGPDQIVCEGTTITVNGSGAGLGGSYAWSGGAFDGVPFVSPVGTITYTVTGTEIGGCSNADNLNITVNPNPVNTVSQSGITLTANAIGATYQWLDCNNSYAIIPGETNQSFTPSSNGNFSASITENGCTDTSVCITINDVSLFENNQTSVLVYPNPSNGKFTIVLKDPLQEKVDFQITNSLGQVVYKGALTSSENQKEINLATGIYYLKINSGDKLETIELIVTE